MGLGRPGQSRNTTVTRPCWPSLSGHAALEGVRGLIWPPVSHTAVDGRCRRASNARDDGMNLMAEP